MISIFVLYFLCAGTFTLAKAALSFSTPFFYVGFRMVVAGILLSGIAWLTGNWQKSSPVARQLLVRVALFAFFGAYIGDLWSLQFLTSIESSLIFNLSPFIAALLSYSWFGERMTRLKWVGLSCGFLSILPHFFIDDAIGSCFSWSRALPIFVLMSAVCMATYGWIVTRELVKYRGFSSLQINGFGMMVAGVLALVCSALFEGHGLAPRVSHWGNFLGLTLSIIIVANVFFVNFYAHLLKKYTATLLSCAGGMCPLFVALLGWFFLGEPLTWKFYTSAALVVTGLFIFYFEEIKQGYIA